MSDPLPASLLKILFIDDDVFFANGYLDELDRHYVTTVARNIFDAENEICGRDFYSCVILDVMMPIPERWTDLDRQDSDKSLIWPDADRQDAQHGLKTGIILLRRYKQLLIEKKLPALILTHRQKKEIEAEVAKLGFPSPLVEVHHKLDTPSFALPHLVRDLIHRVRGSSPLGHTS